MENFAKKFIISWFRMSRYAQFGVGGEANSQTLLAGFRVQECKSEGWPRLKRYKRSTKLESCALF